MKIKIQKINVINSLNNTESSDGFLILEGEPVNEETSGGANSKIEIVPSGRIDYCCECKTDHGYFCPKEESKKVIEEIFFDPETTENPFMKAKINEIIRAVNNLTHLK